MIHFIDQKIEPPTHSFYGIWRSGLELRHFAQRFTRASPFSHPRKGFEFHLLFAPANRVENTPRSDSGARDYGIPTHTSAIIVVRAAATAV